MSNFYPDESQVQVKGPCFFQLWGVSHSVRQIRPQSFDGTLSHPPGFVKTCSFQPIQVGHIVCCLSAHPVHLPGPLFWILLEMNRRHWVRAKAGIRTTCFTLSWRWDNFENVKEGWGDTTLFEYKGRPITTMMCLECSHQVDVWLTNAIYATQFYTNVLGHSNS